MTLPLRRKRPTTAPNSPPAKAKELERVVARSLTAVLAALTLGSTLFAANPPASQSSTLRWRPRTPARTVAIEGSKAINKVQLIEPLNTPPKADPEEGSPADLRFGPDVQEVSQPPQREGIDAIIPDDTSPRRPAKIPNLEQYSRAEPPQLSNDCQTYKAREFRDIYDRFKIDESDLPFCQLGMNETFEQRCWAQTCYYWKSPNLCHKPLYFEDPALERYGHTHGELFEPFVQGVHFFGTLPLLPYKAGVEAPWECMYALGYYEPGSCAPYMIFPFPLNLRGALWEAGAWVGGVYIIP